MAFFIFIGLNAIMAFSANLLAYHYFKRSGFAEQLVTACVIFIAQVTFSILFLGVVVGNLSMFAILMMNTGISGTILFVLRKETGDSISSFREKVRDFCKYLISCRDYFLYIFLFLFLVQIVTLIIKIYYLPPHVSDVLNYHLPPVMEWLQQGNIPLQIDTPVDRINVRALGSGLLLFWIAKFFGNTMFIEFSQFFHSIFLLLISYTIMVKTGIKRNNALRYAVLIYFIPSVLIQSRTCQNHLILAAWTLAALLFTMDVFSGKRAPPTAPHIIFLSMSLGILAGIKLNSPQIIFVFFLSLLLSLGFNKSAAFKFIKENKLKIISGIFIILLLGGYWHIKNIILYHNPTGPYSPTEFAFSQGSLPGILQAMGEIFAKNAVEFPIRISDSLSQYIPGLPRISGFGIQFFVFGIISYIGILILIIKKRIKRNSFVGFAYIFSILLLLSYFLYYYDLYNHRLLLFFPVIGMFFWAFLLAHFRVTGKGLFSVYLDFLITAMIIFNISTCFFSGYANMEFKWKTLFTMRNAPARTTIKYFQYLPGLSPGEWAIIDRYLLPGEPIGYFGDKHSLTFQYYDNKMVRKIYHLGNFPGYELSGAENKCLVFAPEFKMALKKKRIRFIHLNFTSKEVVIKDKEIDHLAGSLYCLRWKNDEGENEKK